MSKNPWAQALEGEMPLHIAIALHDPQMARQAWNRLGHKQIVQVIAAVPELALEATLRIIEMVVATLGEPDAGIWDGVQPAPPFIHDALRLLRADLTGDTDAHDLAVTLTIAAEDQIRASMRYGMPTDREREWLAIDDALFIVEVARGRHLEETPMLQTAVMLDRRLGDMISKVTDDASKRRHFTGHIPPVLRLSSVMAMLHALPLPSVEQIFAAASPTR